MAFVGAQRCAIRGLAIGSFTEIRDFLAYPWFSAYALELGERAIPVLINNV